MPHKTSESYRNGKAPLKPLFLFASLATAGAAAAAFVRFFMVPYLAAHAPTSKLTPFFWHTVRMGYYCSVFFAALCVAAAMLSLILPPRKWNLKFIVVTTLIVGTIARFSTPDMALDTIPRPDGVHYAAISANLLTRGSFMIPTGPHLLPPRYMPGVSFVMCLTQFLNPGNLGLGVIAVFLCSCAAVILIFRLTERLFSRAVAVVAALLLSLSPSYGYYSGQLVSEIPWGLSILFCVSLLVLYPRSTLCYASAGLIAGLGMLFKAPHAGVVTAATLFVFGIALLQRDRFWKTTLSFGFGTAIGLAAWLVYNRLVLQAWFATPYPIYWPEYASGKVFHHGYLLGSTIDNYRFGTTVLGNLPYYTLTFLGLDPRPDRMPWIPPLAMIFIGSAFVRNAFGSFGPAAKRFLAVTLLLFVFLAAPFFFYAWQDVRFFLPVVPLLFILAAVPIASVLSRLSHGTRSILVSIALIGTLSIVLSTARGEFLDKRVHDRVLWERLDVACREYDAIVSDEDPVILTHYGVWSERTELVPFILQEDKWFPPDPMRLLRETGHVVDSYEGTLQATRRLLAEGKRVCLWVRWPHARKADLLAELKDTFRVVDRPEYGIPGLAEILDDGAGPESATHKADRATDKSTRPTANAGQYVPGNSGSQRLEPIELIARDRTVFTLGGHDPPNATAPNRSRPEHEIVVSPFRISRCETSADNYCAFLNDAWTRGWLATSDTGTGIAVFGKTDDGPTPLLCVVGSTGNDSPLMFDGRNEDAPFRPVERNGHSMSNHPMTAVSWYGAAYYCNWVSLEAEMSPVYRISSTANWTRIPGANGFRLPTEAEWELAASFDSVAREKQTWAFGNQWDPALANVAGPDNTRQPWPVDFTPHLVDPQTPLNITGNVWEWCQDWYSDYPKEKTEDPEGPASGTIKIARGGSFITRAESAWCAFRGIADPSVVRQDIGFRMAISD